MLTISSKLLKRFLPKKPSLRRVMPVLDRPRESSWGAAAYIGVDTATSHIAAATGIPCVCLYGPTPVDAWGPAPKCGQSTPYSNDLDIQTVGNVTIVRRDNTGIPCSGCTRHLCAHYNPPQLSRCMQSISVEKVWNALCCHTPIGSTLL